MPIGQVQSEKGEGQTRRRTNVVPVIFNCFCSRSDYLISHIPEQQSHIKRHAARYNKWPKVLPAIRPIYPSCHLVLASQQSPTTKDLQSQHLASRPGESLSRTSTSLHSAPLRDSQVQAQEQLSHPGTPGYSLGQQRQHQQQAEGLVRREGMAQGQAEPGSP